MAILATGNTFADGDQVTSTKLNNIANAATFADDAVDDSTTALSGGKIIIKDGGVTPAKLSTNHPNWDSTGLGVGTDSPSSKLDVETSSSSADGVDINNTSTGDPVIEFQLAGTSKFVMGVDNSDSDKFKIGTTAVETSTCLTIDSTGPQLTIGNGAAADTAIIFDGNAQDFYIALDDSADDLLIGLGSTIGTTPAISIDENLKSTFGGDVIIGGTTPTLTIGDAGAEDTAIVFDGNAKDFYIALDDSADKLVIGEGSTVGTNSILTITDDSVTIGDASAVDTKIVFDGNAQDFYLGLDDSADDLIIGVGSAVGTTPAISITDGRAVTLNTSLTLASGSTVTAVLDQDNMSSDSATSLATQQSIKAYVDAQVDTADTLSEVLAIGNTSGGTDIELSTTDKTQFRDSAIYINSSTDGQLDIVADTEIQIAATTIDINGAVALNGAITGATDITLSGELDAATLDISGNADIDGTTNLDAVDIDGAVQIDATFTSGVDGQGYDTKFFGDTSSAFMLWDTSADDLILSGGAGLVVPDGQLVLGSTAVSSTAAELNLLDGSSANTVVNSKAVIYGSSGEVAGTLSTAAQTSVTSLGTLTALTVDNIGINSNTITANSGALNLTPASGSAIVLDGTINVDAGVVTGATSITSTAFVGDITGDVTGNVSGTAATVTTAAQSNITSLGTLTTLTVDNVIINGTTIGHTDDTDLITVADGALTVAGTIGSGAITSTGIVTAVGTSVFTNLDISGDVDIDGTTNLDVVDIDGAVDMASTLDVTGDITFANDLEINVAGSSNGSKAIVINSSGTNFESDDGMIRGVHASTGSGALTGGYWVKFSANGSDKFTIKGNGDTVIDGALSKGSGSFNIEHPLESKKETHRLVHSFIEGPQADLIYRGKVNLIGGDATVNIDIESGMTDGTFVVLCRDVQSFTTNESGWTAVRSSVAGNILTIEAQDPTSTDSISWMVVGERQDDHMIDTGWTDETGKVIVEPLIEEEEDDE